MRLLNARTLKLESFFGTQPPPYAILSHTWEQEEVLFADIQDKKTPFPDHKLGAYKVKKSCTQARQLGFDHVWIDTCCIDKTSSAELSESINSMFAWYRQADICFAFLGDVNDTNSAVKATVEGSRWFTRGWTLQELVAPRQVIFFDSQWKEIGRREPDGEVNNSAFLDMLGRATRIPSSLLCRDAAGPCSLGGLYQKANEKQHPMRLYHGTCQGCSRKDTLPMFLRDRFSNAQKMSWAARRVTTRREDQAYCMLGLFCVNMPLLYGEGEAAFIRLQEEILRKSDDPSLLAFDHFNMGKAWYTVDTGLLAPSALSFQDSQIRLPRSSRIQTLNRMTLDSKTISLHLLLCPDNGRSRSRLWLAILPCRYEDDLAARPALLLESVSHDNTVFSRVLVKEITVRPVATELNIREKSIHAGGRFCITSVHSLSD
ncbi:heterokaryon incompatibility protein-domain-containing protein [Rhypophila decipiens]|uniref:Heterokaryon incompatibility protein-domain-containing protein n=1 Tax=Rhypophila decipiens TaxID=261697 RepID=A0AAN7B2J1_9PEZI|nr:heterokaryon incompatibility protein-domain-containing protein [Rhypophila decipiens]